VRKIAIIQTRLGSSRLPGKTTLPLGPSTVLEYMVKRLQQCSELDRIIIAVPENEKTEKFREVAKKTHVDFFPGSELDLLDRHYQAAKRTRADIILKIPSDCPLVDPRAIELVLTTFLNSPSEVDYVSNLHPQSYPDGNDVEAMGFSALELAWKEAQAPFQREHTTPFIWDQPERFSILNCTWETGLDFSRKFRYTLDYQEDYAVIKGIVDHFERNQKTGFGALEISEFLSAHPELAKLNSHFWSNSWYQKERAQLKHFHRIYREDSLT